MFDGGGGVVGWSGGCVCSPVSESRKYLLKVDSINWKS